MGRRGDPVVRTPEELVAYLRDCAATCRGELGAAFVESRPSHEHLRFAPPREAMFAGAGGLRLLLGIPGFVELFDVRVPDRALFGDLDAVLCTCGAGSRLEVGVQPCSGSCGRYFLRVADAVLVHRFAVEDESAVAA